MKCFVFLFLTLSLPFPALTQTITDAQYIQSRIDRANLVHVDHLRGFFQQNPVYDYECFKDSTNIRYESRLREIFEKYGSPDGATGIIEIALKESKLGFDLVISKTEAHPFEELYRGRQSLSCTITEKDHCPLLSYSERRDFQLQTSDEKVTHEGKKSEDWNLYFKDGQLYGKREILLEGKELGWFGQNVGSIRYSSTQVCVLTTRTNKD